MTPIAPHLTAFLREYLPRDRASSPHTCDAYAYSFQLLLCFAAEWYGTSPSALTVEQLDLPLVLAFLEHIESSRGNTASTRNARLAAVKSFAHFLKYRIPSAIEQVRCILAIPHKKTDDALVAYLNHDELQALLDAPDPSTRSGTRDRTMLHVCFAAGLRVSELIGLRLDDLQTHPKGSVRIRGKGRESFTLDRRPAEQPRYEPRARWSDKSKCARPQVPSQGEKGCRLEMDVQFAPGQQQLPIVTLRTA